VLVIDDTAIPKKGTHSVGVAAQYASALGKTANCQTLAWLISEHRTSGEKKYYLANLRAQADRRTLAATIKARWICEQALALDHLRGQILAG
jgi:DDE superfamily endonuclease